METDALISFHQQKSIQINDFFQSCKKCLFLKTKSVRTTQNLIYHIESDFIFSEVFYNIETPEQLLFVLRQQFNPNKHNPEYGFFVNGNHAGLNPFAAIRTLANLLRTDTMHYEQQIEELLRRINGSRYVIILSVKNDFSAALYDVLVWLCQKEELECKFIFVYDIPGEIHFELLKGQAFSENLNLIYSDELLQKIFDDLDTDQLNSLRAITSDDIHEMLSVHESFKRFLPCDTNLKNFIQLELQKILQEDTNINSVLGLASYLVNNFSQEQLSKIFTINASLANIMDMANTLCKCIDHKLIESENSKYRFYAQLLKDLIKSINSNNQRLYHIAIEVYLAQYCPFDYALRKYHLREAQDSKYTEILAMQFLNCLHFRKNIASDMAIEFKKYFSVELFDSLIEVYRLIDAGDFKHAQYKLNTIDTLRSNVLRSEIEYLNIYLDWKRGNSWTEHQFRARVDSILNIDCEPEIRLMTLLLKISIISNEGNHFENSETPYEVYYNIISELKLYSGTDANYILNVVYRKSNVALGRAAAMNLVKQSFKFFAQNKELYTKQYFMSGINYVALLLQSESNFTDNQQWTTNRVSEIYDCTNPYQVAKKLKDELSSDCPPDILNYLTNNYFIAQQLFSAYSLDPDELDRFAANNAHISLGSQVMTYMNIGTLFAMLEDYSKAEDYWTLAEQTNSNKDEYYSYIIQSNRAIVTLIQGRWEAVKLPNRLPFIMTDNEVKQYMNLRQTIIFDLMAKGKQISYCKIQEVFCEKFNEEFGGLNLYFFSQPYILSDVQFWSDN